MIVLNIGVFIVCLAGAFLAGYIVGIREELRKKRGKQIGTRNNF